MLPENVSNLFLPLLSLSQTGRTSLYCLILSLALRSRFPVSCAIWQASSNGTGSCFKSISKTSFAFQLLIRYISLRSDSSAFVQRDSFFWMFFFFCSDRLSMSTSVVSFSREYRYSKNVESIRDYQSQLYKIILTCGNKPNFNERIKLRKLATIQSAE